MKTRHICLVLLVFLLVSCETVQSLQLPEPETTLEEVLPSATCTLTEAPVLTPTSSSTPIPTATATATPDPIPPNITETGLFMWKLARDLGVSLVVAEENETGKFFCPLNYQQDMYVFQDNVVSKVYATALMEGFSTQEDPAGFLVITAVFGYDVNAFPRYQPQVGLGFSLYEGEIPSDCWGYTPSGNSLEICLYDKHGIGTMYMTNQNGPGEIYGPIVAYPLNNYQLSVLKDMYSFQYYPFLYLVKDSMEYHCP